jgi:hypothetical protein
MNRMPKMLPNMTTTPKASWPRIISTPIVAVARAVLPVCLATS